MGQTISDLNDAERDWLRANIQLAAEIARGYGVPVEPGDRLDPEQLDVSWARWLAAHDRDVEDPNRYINAFGAALGQHFVGNLGLEWKVVADSDGTEVAVWGRVGEILMFPANLVAKRYVAGENSFFRDVAAQAESRVREIRTSHERPSGLARLFRRSN